MNNPFGSRFGAVSHLLIALLIGIGALFATGANAQIFVSTDSPGGVGEYNINGTAIDSSLITGLSGPGQVVVSGSTLYVGNTATGIVGTYNAGTGAAINANFITGFSQPNGLAVSGTILYVADVGTGTVGEYNAATGAAINASFITGLSSPNFLTLSGTTLFVTNYTGTGFVGEYNAVTGQAINANLVTGLSDPGGTVATSSTTLFVVVQGSNAVAEYNTATGGVINASFVTGLDHPVYVTSLSGTALLVTNQYADTVGEYSESTGATVNGSLITGLGLANSVAVASNVTTNSSPAVGGTTAGAGLFSNGVNATVTAAPAGGYTFSNWTVNGSIVSTSSSYTFTVSGSASLTANFTIASPSGKIYVSNDGTGTIGEYNTSGSVINASLVMGLNGPGEVAVSGSTLYVAHSSNGTVGAYNATTGAAINASFITGLNLPNGLWVSGNILYVSDINNNVIGEYNATTGAVINANFITGLNSPNSIFVSGSTLIVTNYLTSGTVGEFDAVTGAAINRSLITGIDYPCAPLLSGTTLYVISQGQDSMGEYNASTGAAINSSFITGLDNPATVALSGSNFLITNQYSSSVGAYSAATGAVVNASFITGAGYCNGIAVAYNVSATTSPSGSGLITGAGLYSNGNTVTVTASANPSFVFNNWMVSGTVVSTSTSYSFTANNGSALVANFTNVGTAMLVVAPDPTNGGTVSGSGTFTVGSSEQISATANSGYNFTGWNDGVSTNPRNVTVPAGGAVYVANFVLQSATESAPLTVLADPPAAGTVLGSGTFTIGSSQQISATPNTGWNFTNWSDGVSTNPRNVPIPVGGVTYVANFVSQSATESAQLSVVADPPAAGVVLGSGTYTIGSSQQISATANAGWNFTGWSDGISINPRNVPIPVGGAAYVANFVSQSATESAELTVLADPDTGGTVAGSGTYTIGSSQEISATANSGWLFTGWNDGVTTNPRSVPIPVGGVTYAADFAQTAVLDVVASPSNGGTAFGSGTFEVGSFLEISASANAGYTFTGWSDGVTDDPRTVALPLGGVTYTADFAVLYYPPATPTNLSPVNNAMNVSAVATLDASPFSDPDPNATQIASEWLVTQVSDSTIVQDITEDTGDMTFLPGVSLSASTSYQWQVRYEDSHDLWSPLSAKTLFMTGSHVYRPDLVIGFSLSALIGTDIYSSDGEGETLSTTLLRLHNKTALVIVQNDGNVNDSFLLHGDPGNAHFVVHYYNGPDNVTKAVEDGTFKLRNMRPGFRHGVRALVTPLSTATLNEVLPLKVTVSSESDPASTDTVVYSVTAE